VSEPRARGEGNWRRRLDGGWELRIVVGGQRRSFYGRTKASATAKAKEAQQQATLGLRPGRQTVGEYLREWLAGKAKSNLRPATARRYGQIVDQLVKGLGRHRLADLRPADVDRYLREKREAGAASLTVNHHRTVLSTALAQAEKRELVRRNVARLSEPERVPHEEVAYLAPDQVQVLMDVVRGHPLEALVIVAVNTGLRQGELLGLRWEDVDLDSATLQVRRALQRVDKEWRFVDTKTGRSRRAVTLPALAVAALRAHRLRQSLRRLPTSEDLVFTSRTGRPLSGTSVTHTFQAILQRAGLPRLRFHDLRHTHVALLIRNGEPPMAIMERLGHSTIVTTMNVYGHLYPAAGRELADRLDQMFGTAATV
jgi:integrase